MRETRLQVISALNDTPCQHCCLGKVEQLHVDVSVWRVTTVDSIHICPTCVWAVAESLYEGTCATVQHARWTMVQVMYIQVETFLACGDAPRSYNGPIHTHIHTSIVPALGISDTTTQVRAKQQGSCYMQGKATGGQSSQYRLVFFMIRRNSASLTSPSPSLSASSIISLVLGKVGKSQ